MSGRSDDTERVALVVVDVQADFLDRPGLRPAAETLIDAVAALLGSFRGVGLPVAHIHTVVPPDGTGALSHWRSAGRLWCVEGTPGALPPPATAPAPGEFAGRKTHYSGFADPGLEPWLTTHGVTTVAVAGLMEHACVRATALDAAAAGFDVLVVTDAVASDDPDHARATRQWLGGRVAEMVRSDELVRRVAVGGPTGSAPPSPVSASPAQRAAEAAVTASNTQRRWAATSPEQRAAAVARWAEVVSDHAEELAARIVGDVHKPLTQARDEVRRTVSHLQAAARLATVDDDISVGAGVRVRRRPVGVVGLIMPWNNPLALPAGKAAAALAVGNAVVLKPSPEAPSVTDAIVTSAVDAGIPAELIQVVEGGATAAMAVVCAPGVDAVAVTGSIATGRRIAAQCTRLARPLQAELGGNNAVVVLADTDLELEVPRVVGNAFAFAGQRCTALRRAIVVRPVLDSFLSAATAAMDALVVGDPTDPQTHVGPLISAASARRVAAAVDAAVADGARLIHRVTLSDHDGRGWSAPTLLVAGDPDLRIVQDETFGPVLVVQPAHDEDHAIRLANGVEQGLLGAVCTEDPVARRRVADALAVGIVQIGGAPPPIDADAPFGGWGASGIGPPEHGRWDLDLMTRVQAVYEP